MRAAGAFSGAHVQHSLSGRGRGARFAARDILLPRARAAETNTVVTVEPTVESLVSSESLSLSVSEEVRSLMVRAEEQQERLAALRQALTQAVLLERFSEAAELRDEALALERADPVGSLAERLKSAIEEERYDEAAVLSAGCLCYRGVWSVVQESPGGRDPHGYAVHVSQEDWGRLTGRFVKLPPGFEGEVGDGNTTGAAGDRDVAFYLYCEPGSDGEEVHIVTSLTGKGATPMSLPARIRVEGKNEFVLERAPLPFEVEAAAANEAMELEEDYQEYAEEDEEEEGWEKDEDEDGDEEVIVAVEEMQNSVVQRDGDDGLVVDGLVKPAMVCRRCRTLVLSQDTRLLDTSEVAGLDTDYLRDEAANGEEAMPPSPIVRLEVPVPGKVTKDIMLLPVDAAVGVELPNSSPSAASAAADNSDEAASSSSSSDVAPTRSNWFTAHMRRPLSCSCCGGLLGFHYLPIDPSTGNGGLEEEAEEEQDGEVALEPAAPAEPFLGVFYRHLTFAGTLLPDWGVPLLPREWLPPVARFRREPEPPVSPAALKGLFIGRFESNGPEVVRVTVDEFGQLTAVKVTGDVCVPAGEVSFCATMTSKGRVTDTKFPDEWCVKEAYKGFGFIARAGYRKKQEVNGLLLQFEEPTRSASGASADGLKLSLGRSVTQPGESGATFGFLWSVGVSMRLTLFWRAL